MHNVSDAKLMRISGGATSRFTLATIDADSRDPVAGTRHSGSNPLVYLIKTASTFSN